MADIITEFYPEEIEAKLRDVLSWARERSARYRVEDPVQGRAMALLATNTEEALRVLLLPVP